jgi:hypothetical protein
LIIIRIGEKSKLNTPANEYANNIKIEHYVKERNKSDPNAVSKINKNFYFFSFSLIAIVFWRPC